MTNLTCSTFLSERCFLQFSVAFKHIGYCNLYILNIIINLLKHDLMVII